VNIFIATIRIYSHVLSVTFNISFDDTESLQSLIRKPLRFAIYAGISLENSTAIDNASTREIVWFRGKIVSIGKNYFVVHTTVNMAVLVRLVKARKTSLRIRIDRDKNNRDYVQNSVGQTDLATPSENRRIENEGSKESLKENPDSNNPEKISYYGPYSLALLKTILHSASQKLGIQEEELIYKFTTYTKNGKTYEGKRNLDDVSEKQKVIVYDRVKKLLKVRDIPKCIFYSEIPEN